MQLSAKAAPDRGRFFLWVVPNQHAPPQQQPFVTRSEDHQKKKSDLCPMNPTQLAQHIHRKKSFLCVGLDPELSRVPRHLLGNEDPIFDFCRQLIEATRDYAVAYKPNIAFFERLGPAGWDTLQRVLDEIPDDCLAIADAKRGDIGNTARMYASTFYETYAFDACTVAPYMGSDSVTPFLDFAGKWTFLLALTSNPGAADFQLRETDNEALYEAVIRKSGQWAAESNGHLGYVVGATRPEYIEKVRSLTPDAFLLVPGVGAQGGDLEAVCKAGKNDLGGLLINASRSIMYAGSDRDFADLASDAAQAMQQQMAAFV